MHFSWPNIYYKKLDNLCVVFFGSVGCLFITWLFKIPDIWTAANYSFSEDKGNKDQGRRKVKKLIQNSLPN